MVTVIVGGQFGDEGKGKIISYIATKDKPKIIARAGIGPNAGHTVYKNGKRYALRMIPCGFVNDRARLLIGAGVLVDPKVLLKEIKETKTKGRCFVDKRCAIIEQKHRDLDSSNKHLSEIIGSTKTGCGPANADRVYRTVKLAQDVPELKGYVTDVPLELDEAINKGEKVLIEGTQGFALSLYYGTYPFVTSKDTSASTIAADVGVGPTKIDDVMVTFKAYITRVGGGPLRTEINAGNIKKHVLWSNLLKKAKKDGIDKRDVNTTLAEYLDEKGTVTGRYRRVGNFDFELAKYSIMVNGATQLAVTCLDKLFPECFGVRGFEELSNNAKSYLKNIEKKLGLKASLISTGPDINHMIDLRQNGGRKS